MKILAQVGQVIGSAVIRLAIARVFSSEFDVLTYAACLKNASVANIQIIYRLLIFAIAQP